MAPRVKAIVNALGHGGGCTPPNLNAIWTLQVQVMACPGDRSGLGTGIRRVEGVCSGYARKSVTSRKWIKNNVLQYRPSMPIATKVCSELIRRPKKVLRSHAQNPLILQV